MNCPVCTTTQLAMADRLGIEIDYCPKCRGVWLDRGELDRIIERSLRELPPERPSDSGGFRPDHGQSREHHDHDHDDEHDDDRRPHRRKSLLKDLFDF
jgi:Zn-finger nucleic acid-binding protein